MVARPFAARNGIAESYQRSCQNAEGESGGGSRLSVEIVDRATPGFHPVRPNKPLNLAIAALAGLLVGTITGAARVTLTRG